MYEVNNILLNNQWVHMKTKEIRKYLEKIKTNDIQKVMGCIKNSSMKEVYSDQFPH